MMPTSGPSSASRPDDIPVRARRVVVGVPRQRVEGIMRMLTGRPRFAGQRGQNLVEYSLIILLVVLAVIGGLIIVGPMVGSIFSNVVPAL